MTVLAAPPHICQLDIADPDRREACGPCSVAMIERAYGQTAGGADVEAWLRARYREQGVARGTDVSELLAYVAARGLGERCTHVGRDLAAISAALAAGQYVLVLFHDDNNWNPNAAGPFTHFAVLLGVDHGMATISNPGHHTAEDAGPLNAFFAALIDAVAIAPPPAAPITEANDNDAMRIARHFTFDNLQREVVLTDNGERLRIFQFDQGGGQWGWHEAPDLNAPDGAVVLAGAGVGGRIALDPNGFIDIDSSSMQQLHISVPTADGRTLKVFTSQGLPHWVAEVIG